MNPFKHNYISLFIITVFFTTLLTPNIFANKFTNYSVSDFTSKELLDIKFSNNVYVIAAESIYTSKDGVTWDITFSSGLDMNYNTITVLNNEFIATGENVQPIKSSDGTNWSPLRLHDDILPNKIHVLGKTYFWTDSKNQLLYSYNLLTWNTLPIASGQKFLSANFINDKCFFSTGTSEYNPNYFILSEDLTQKPLDDSIKSIEDIYYIPKTSSYIQLKSNQSKYSKEPQVLTSTDGQSWKKTSLILDKNINIALNAKQFTIISAGGKLFLKTNDSTYTTSDGLNWQTIKDYGNFKTIKYSGKYFYSSLNSNNLCLSKDGINWYTHTMTEKATTSITNILESTIFLTNPSFDTIKSRYTSKLYAYRVTDTMTNDSNHTVLINPIAPSTKTELLKIKIGSNKIQIKEGRIIEIDPVPSVQQNNTLVSLRSIILPLGGTLDWEPSTNKINVYCNNKTIELWINTNKATVDGKSFTLPIETKLINNKTIVALRPIIENLGYTITWLDGSKEIVIMD